MTSLLVVTRSQLPKTTSIVSVRLQGELIGLRLNVSQCELKSHSDRLITLTLSPASKRPTLLSWLLLCSVVQRRVHILSLAVLSCPELLIVFDCFNPTMHLSCSARVLAHPS